MIRFVVLGDIHAPFHSKWALGRVLDFIKEKKPRYVVQVGDAYDFFSLSRFPRNPFIAPIDEINEGRQTLVEMWSYIKKISPKSRCVQLLGNHEDRIHKKMQAQLPELIGVAKIDHLFQFEGVKTVNDTREVHVIENIGFQHGYYSSHAAGRLAKEHHMNMVCGHTHTGGLKMVPSQGKPLWELNAGLLGDPKSKVMTYTRSKWNDWTLGFGVIDELGPRFIPLNKKR